jgi:hypothetical protein
MPIRLAGLSEPARLCSCTLRKSSPRADIRPKRRREGLLICVGKKEIFILYLFLNVNSSK